MPAVLLTPPSAEPISLADLKAHLRISTTDQDAVLTRVIAAARAVVETSARRQLMAQGWRVTLDAWPASGRITLPVAPVTSVIAVTVADALGGQASVPPSAYRLDKARVPAVLLVGPGAVSPGVAVGGIAIDLVVGHAAAADVPAPLREAVLRLAAHWAEHRLEADASSVPPPVVEALIAPWRVFS